MSDSLDGDRLRSAALLQARKARLQERRSALRDAEAELDAAQRKAREVQDLEDKAERAYVAAREGRRKAQAVVRTAKAVAEAAWAKRELAREDLAAVEPDGLDGASGAGEPGSEDAQAA